jgi:hypothetical protein
MEAIRMTTSGCVTCVLCEAAFVMSEQKDSLSLEQRLFVQLFLIAQEQILLDLGRHENSPFPTNQVPTNYQLRLIEKVIAFCLKCKLSPNSLRCTSRVWVSRTPNDPN